MDTEYRQIKKEYLLKEVLVYKEKKINLFVCPCLFLRHSVTSLKCLHGYLHTHRQKYGL